MIYRKAFTLIELIVVIAIVAILAAIAVVNLTEAQTRSKVTRAKADIRTFFVGLEAYSVDYRDYPFPQVGVNRFDQVFELTTSLAYLSTVDIRDPFKPVDEGKVLSYKYVNYSRHGWAGKNETDPSQIISFRTFAGCSVVSSGPDRDVDGLSFLPFWAEIGKGIDRIGSIYDPTNGTNSSGDIGRWNGRPAYYNAF